MLKKVAYKNFKGSDACLDLAPLTVVTGANFAGKSTLLQAIIVGATGEFPGIGRTNKAVYEAFASGPVMTTQLEFLTGENVAKQWKQNAKSVGMKPSGEAPAGLSLLNADEFISAKPAARLTMLANASGHDMKELTGEIATACKEAGIPMPAGETVLEQADAALAAIAEAATASNARRDQFDKTMMGLAELEAKGAAIADPGDTLTAWDAARFENDQAARVLQDLMRRSGEIESTKGLLSALLEQAPGADKPPEFFDAAGYQKAVMESTQAKASRHKMEGELERLEETADAIAPNHDPEKLAELEELAKFDWQEVYRSASNIKASAEAELRSLEKQIAAARAIIDEPINDSICPHCGSTDGNWASKVKHVMLARQDALNGLLEEQARAKEDLEAANVKSVEYQGNIAALKALPVLWKEEQVVDAAQAAKAALPGLQAQINDAMEREQTLREAVEAMEETGAGFKSRSDAHQLFLKYTAEIQRAEMLPQTLENAHAAARSADARLQTCHAAHEAAAPARMARQEYTLTVKQLAQCRVEAEAEESKLEKLKATAKALKTRKEEEQRKCFAPVIATAAEFSQHILPTPLTLHPTNGQIGRWSGATFISFPVMSGAEQLVAVASLQTALAINSKGILMLDEVSRMRAETKEKFLAAIKELLSAGKISQAILVDHNVDADGYRNFLKIAV